MAGLVVAVSAGLGDRRKVLSFVFFHLTPFSTAFLFRLPSFPFFPTDVQRSLSASSQRVRIIH